MESTYQIVEVTQKEEILYTTVEFNFGDEIATIDIAHSSPRSVEEIEENIKNRGLTELYKRSAASSISRILQEIPLNTEKPIGAPTDTVNVK